MSKFTALRRILFFRRCSTNSLQFALRYPSTRILHNLQESIFWTLWKRLETKQKTSYCIGSVRQLSISASSKDDKSVATVGEKCSLGSALWIQKIQPFSSSSSHVSHQYAELLQSGRHATCIHLWRLGSSKNSIGSRVDMEPVHQKFQHESARFSNATDLGQQAKHQGHMTWIRVP